MKVTATHLLSALCTLFVFRAVLHTIWIRSIGCRLYGGLVINGLDPYFHLRATKLLMNSGWESYATWFDSTSWYPIGRAVGATTFPLLHIAAVCLFHTVRFISYIFPINLLTDTVDVFVRIFTRLEPLKKCETPSDYWSTITLNDVCCLVPCWFALVSLTCCGLLAGQIFDVLCATFGHQGPCHRLGRFVTVAIALSIYGILPASVDRSNAGNFDNECIAVPLMISTLIAWINACNTHRIEWAALAGLFYGGMSMSWGGYVFIGNVIAVHVVLEAFLQAKSMAKVYAWFLGTSLTIAVGLSPPVGTLPFRSFEQMLPWMAAAIVFALRSSTSRNWGTKIIRSASASVTILVSACLFDYISIRVTGVPWFRPLPARLQKIVSSILSVVSTSPIPGQALVDSVSEHGSVTHAQRWWYYHVFWHAFVVSFVELLTVALWILWLNFQRKGRDSGLRINASALHLIIIVSCVVLVIGSSMTRLVSIAAPFVATATAAVFGFNVYVSITTAFTHWVTTLFKQIASAAYLLCVMAFILSPIETGDWNWSAFEHHAYGAAKSLSDPGLFVVLTGDASPQDLQPERIRSWTCSFVPLTQWDPQHAGPSLIDEYRTAYEWIRTQTPTDARILAWWDYGYHLAEMSNRTTLADGSTWTTEHIALIARMFVTPLEESHKMVRHVADYVVVYTGARWDDANLIRPMARISQSVFPDTCVNANSPDADCVNFGFYDGDLSNPTPETRASMLYQMRFHSERHGDRYSQTPKVEIDHTRLFEEVYRSPFNLLRVFEVKNVSLESKIWVENHRDKCVTPSRLDAWHHLMYATFNISDMCYGRYPYHGFELSQLLLRQKRIVEHDYMEKRV